MKVGSDWSQLCVSVSPWDDASPTMMRPLLKRNFFVLTQINPRVTPQNKPSAFTILHAVRIVPIRVEVAIYNRVDGSML